MTRPLGAVDFETDAIGPRPNYPPVPVGVALRSAAWKRGKYLAWGHPTENNCSRADGVRQLKAFVREHRVICHHAGFDLDVAETHCGVSWPSEHDDTLLLAFLVDPDSPSLSLKPLGERYLGRKPKERDALFEWILANVPEATKKTAGAYICRAPGGLVGKYAEVDVELPLRLYPIFWKVVGADERMRVAYERELRVTRTLVRMERRGIPVRERELRADIEKYQALLEKIELGLLRKLKVPKPRDARAEFAWSGPNFAERLLASGLVESLPLTEKGNPSTSAENLATVMPKELAHEFEVRAQITTCLNTFMRPWLTQAEAADGLMFARYNQVRNSDEWGKFTGARTGRLSMTPNFQNVIRSDKDERVPKLRDYVACKYKKRYRATGQRDYSQQELRLLGHFEDGPLKAAYVADPTRDGHELVVDLIKAQTGIALKRRPVKDLNFGLIYGQGLALTAEKMGIPREEAAKLRKAHAASLPGVPALQKELKERVRAGEPIFTWGGRRYFCEPSICKGCGAKYDAKLRACPGCFSNHRQAFDYKMLNRLIQGSAADVTKQAMINYDSLGAFADENPMILQVHDELLFGIFDARNAKVVHAKMREAMLDIDGIDIPMLSDGKLGTVSWHQMQKVKY